MVDTDWAVMTPAAEVADPGEWLKVQAALADAAAMARAVLENPAAAARWNDPSALAYLTVGALAGHMLGALKRLPYLLDEPEPDATQSEPVALAVFYGSNRVASSADLESPLHRFVRKDASERASRGPEAIISAFASLADALPERLSTQSPRRRVPVMTVANGCTTLQDYTISRVMEMVVHTDDLAASLGIAAPDMHAKTGDLVLAALFSMARTRNSDLTIVRAFTRNERQSADILRVL